MRGGALRSFRDHQALGVPGVASPEVPTRRGRASALSRLCRGRPDRAHALSLQPRVESGSPGGTLAVLVNLQMTQATHSSVFCSAAMYSTSSDWHSEIVQREHCDPVTHLGGQPPQFSWQPFSPSFYHSKVYPFHAEKRSTAYLIAHRSHASVRSRRISSTI